MKYSNTIEYNINTKLDSSGLTKLQAQIKQLENSMQQMSNRELLNSDKVQAAKTQLEGLNTALTNSFNSSLGILDLSKFRAELDSSGVSAAGLQSAFSMMGAEGQAALNGLTTQIANFNGGMERTSSAIDKIFTTFSNTFRWGLVSSFFSQFMNAIHSSVDYVKELDDSLTQIMLVTDYNRDSMNQFAKSANEAAKAVSMTTTGMTNASLIFAQQGYDLGQSQELATLSAKLANASQQDTATTSDQITAYMNAYGLQNSMEELTQQMDNWAKIANVSAADVGELAQASQRAASMANTVGVSGEALAAQIATIESVTREAPEQIGNGLKTLYARFSDISGGGKDEDGVDLGKVTAQLDAIGVKVLDQFGNIRTMDNIMEDLMDVWADLDDTSKIAAAQSLAGKYQVNRFVALMDNRDMYEEYIGATGSSATGTLDQMNKEYADSIAGRSAKLQASLEGLFSTVFNTDDIYPWMDAAQDAVDLLQQFFDALGGGKTVLLGITTLLAQAFNQNIARSINDTIANRNLGKIREQNINSVNDTLDRVGIDRTQGVGAYISKTADQAKLGALNEVQYDAYINDVKQWVDASTALANSEKELQSNVDLVNAIYAKAGADGAFKESKDSPYNTTFLQEGRAEVLDKLDSLDFTAQEQAAAKYAETLHRLSTVFEEVKQDTSEEQTKQDELATQTQLARDALDDFTKVLGMSKEVAGQWDQDFENVAADLAAIPENSVEAEKALANLYGRVAELRKGLFEIKEDKNVAKQTVAGATDKIQNLETQVSFNEAQDKRAAENATARGSNIDNQQNIKQILDTFNAIQQLTFAWQAFQNLGSIWANADLTDGEKVLQTIMNLSMAIPQLITGFGQLGTSIKNVGSFLQNSYFTALKQAAAAELENAKAAEAKQKQQKDAIEAERAALKVQYEKIKNDQAEAQGEIFLTKLEVEKNQALVNTLSILDLANQKALERAKSELEVAKSLAVEMQAQEALNKVRLNSLKQEYNEKEASGKLGNKERHKYRKAIAEGELLSKDNEAQTAEADRLINEAKIRVQTAEEKQAASSAALASAREKLEDSTNRLTAAEEKLATGKEKLQEIESKIDSTISESLSVLADFKNAQEGVAEAAAKYAKVIGLAEGESLTLGTAIKGLPTAFSSLAGAVGLSTAGLGVFLGVAAGAVALIGGVAYVINKEAEEQKAQAEALAEINQRITETANVTKESTAEWQSLKNEFKESGDASDEFVDALLKQAEAYGINDAAVDIAKGHYEELIKKIEEARTKALEAAEILSAQQLQDNTKNPADAFKDDLNLEDIGITSQSKVETFDLGGSAYGTQGLKWTETYDQNPYEQYQLIKDSITKSKEDVDDLYRKWNQAINDGDKVAAASYKRQADAASANIHELENKLEEFSYLEDSVRELEENSLLNRAAVDEDTTKIFSEGSFEEVKAKIEETLESDENLKQSIGEIDDSTVEELAASMMQLYENTNLVGEAVEETGLALSNYFNQDKIGEILKDADLVDKKADETEINDAFQKYVERFKEMGGAGIDKDQVNTVREEIDELNASLEEETEILEKLDKGSKVYKNQEKKIASLENQIEHSQTQLEQLAAAALETSNGMDELSSKWKDIDDALSNSESPGELAKTYDELQGILGKLLNVDPTMITQDFMESADVLAALKDIADGDTEAIWRLREAFGSGDLVLNAYLDTIGFEGDRDKLLALVQEAQATLPDLEVGAHLENEQFLNALTEMVQDGQIAAEDIQRIFNGLGYDVEIHHRTMTYTGVNAVFKTARLAGASLGEAKAAAADASTGVDYSTGDSVTVDVPSFTFTKKGGGTGGHDFRSNTNGSSGKGSCFVAGTLVTTLTGFKSIEKIQKGDIVLSYNEKIKVNEYSEVLQTMIHDTTEPIYTLHIKDEQLRVTGVHRFLVTNKITCGIPRWVHAADLKVGNWVMFADGSWHVIHKIDINIEYRTVYNFEVSHNHNYYVGRNQILAHNKGGKSCFVAGTQISTSLGFKAIETIQPNDVVLSYNEQTGNNEYSSVVQTMIHNTKESIYTLYIQNEQLRVTGIHRFFITKNILTGIPQWIAVENLKVGDWVLFANGTWHVIWKIEVNIEQQIVYNFEVSGNHNYYVGHNQILAHNKGSSGKKGGGKKKEIKQKEEREHEKDYYEEVNSQLDKTEKILSKIEKEEDRLIGDKARANQNKQLKLLQKEIDLNEKKLKIQKRELKDVDALIKKEDKRAEKAALNAGVRANIPGVVLDEDGIVSNYEQISKAIDKTYNDLVKKYNEAAKKGNEKLAEKIEKEMSKFDDYSKNLLEQIKRHNKLQGEIVETEDDLESLADAIEDVRIDAYKASQEAIDNLKEIRESAAELDKFFRNFDDSSFMNKFSIDDTPYGDLIEDLSKLDNIYSVTKEDANAFYQDLINQKEEALKNTKDEDEKKAIQKSIDFFTEQQGNLKDGANLNNGLLGLAQQDLARLQGWIDNPKAKDNIYGDNEAALFEAYQEAYERTLGLFKDYRELVQDTRDDILDIYSDAEEAIERQIDQFDRLSEKMERISDTYTLYYGEDSYDQLNQFYAQQGNIMQNQLNQLTAAYNYWQEQYQKALEIGDEKLINEMQDLMDDAEDAMLDAAQELAELWVEKFENAVEASSQHIYKDLFGSNDIDELTDNWELQKDYMDRYRDDVEKAYEVDKLRNKYLDLLDDAQGSSVQTQNRIRQQMQEQLDLLNGQATVSEYDVKLANAKLEILQKQIALEDAQRNKNKMQLRRDTQGNYRYVYTADQGDVREAQQDLADSEYDAYEMTKEETVANNDRAINLLQDYIEKRAAIWNKYKDDATALGINLANLEAEYGDSFKALAEDFTNTSAGMYDVLNWLVKNGSADTTTAALGMLDALYDKNGEVKDKTGQDWMDMANLITDQVLPNIESAVTKADLEMEDQAVELKESMVGPDGALTKIGSGADDVANSMDKATDATRTLATATDDLFTALGADDGKLQEALDKLAEYEKQLRQTQQTTSDLSKQLNEANKTIAAKNAEALNYKTILDYQSGAKKFKVGQVVTLKKGTWVSYHRDGDQYDANGDNGFRLSKDTQVKISHVNEHHTNGYGDTSQLAKYNIGFYEVGKEATKETGTGMANKSDTKKTERWHLNESMLKQALTYDTGGYTGEWSNDESNLSKNGKLAVLHQKELVLNATDTENILAAITLMRDITQSTMGGLTNIGKVFSTNFSSAFNSTTEQRVEIQASFPNATDAEDIRAALLDLSDKAYQYANRTI